MNKPLREPIEWGSMVVDANGVSYSLLKDGTWWSALSGRIAWEQIDAVRQTSFGWVDSGEA